MEMGTLRWEDGRLVPSRNSPYSEFYLQLAILVIVTVTSYLWQSVLPAKQMIDPDQPVVRASFSELNPMKSPGDHASTCIAINNIHAVKEPNC